MADDDRRTDDWRICVDFGTAASKAAIGSQSGWFNRVAPVVRPLPIGRFSGNSDPLLTPSAVFIENGRIYFGPTAIERAKLSKANREPLQSFKMWLSARDLPALLDSAARRSVDPTGQLTNKSILTFYIGYLSALVAECIGADPVLAELKSKILWRYSRPDWPGARMGVHDAVTKKLFETGIHASEILKADYLGVSGLDIDEALNVIGSAPQESSGIIEGGVLEAHAVAAAHATASNLTSSLVMIVDIGAGTTDFDGFLLKTSGTGAVEMLAIPASKLTISDAGDQVDKILMNAVLDKAGVRKDVKAQAALWRSMASSIRDLKRQAFLHEKCAVRFENKAILLTKSHIESRRDFKDLIAKIKDQFEASLTQTCLIAEVENVDSVSLILSGGGANLPFVQNMASRAEKTWRKGARVKLEPLSPAWVHRGEFAEGLAPLFQQLAVAMGGTSPLIGADQLLGVKSAVRAAGGL